MAVPDTLPVMSTLFNGATPLVGAQVAATLKDGVGVGVGGTGVAVGQIGTVISTPTPELKPQLLAACTHQPYDRPGTTDRV